MFREMKRGATVKWVSSLLHIASIKGCLETQQEKHAGQGTKGLFSVGYLQPTKREPLETPRGSMTSPMSQHSKGYILSVLYSSLLLTVQGHSPRDLWSLGCEPWGVGGSQRLSSSVSVAQEKADQK